MRTHYTVPPVRISYKVLKIKNGGSGLFFYYRRGQEAAVEKH